MIHREVVSASYRRPLVTRVYGRLARLYWRIAYAWRFARIGASTLIESPFWVIGPSKIELGDGVTIWRHARIEAIGVDPAVILRIGDGSIIQPYVHIGAVRSIEIGKHVLIASNVYITDHDHDFSDPDNPVISNGKLLTAPVVLEDFSWIGEGAKILAGVTVGKGSIVGAGSVVTRDIPPYHIAVGSPARVVKYFDDATRRWISVSVT
jgi:acetyltransferase-like isoleucine patch superfamily enzyme